MFLGNRNIFSLHGMSLTDIFVVKKKINEIIIIKSNPPMNFKKLFFVQANELSKKGNSFQIDLDIEIPKMNLDEDESVALTPVLEEGIYRLELPNVLINGKARYKGYKQMTEYLGEPAMLNTYKIYKVFKAKKFSKRICYYNVKIAYESWMDNAKIKLKGIENIPDSEAYIGM